MISLLSQLSHNIMADPHISQALPLGIGLGVVALYLKYPLLKRITPLLMRYEPFHYEPIGDSPGVPGHYDYPCIAAMCSLPDPQDFLGSYSYLPLERGIKFRMTMPPCRYWSVTLYPGMYDPCQDVIPSALSDTDMVPEPDGSYQVVASLERPQGCKNWMATQGIQRGVLVFRRYCVPQGVRVDYPEIRRLDDNALLRPASTTTATSMAMEKVAPQRYNHLLKCGLLMYLTLLCLGWSTLAANVVTLVAVTVLVSTTYLLYFVGRVQMQRRMEDNQVTGLLHQVIEPTGIHYGKNSAWPHPHHKYYVFQYDTTKGDVVVKGSILKGKQKYWSMVFYSMDGVPLSQYYNDTTIVPTTTTEQQIDYKVVLSSQPTSTSSSKKNRVDTREAVKGVCVMRCLYPEHNDVFRASKPSLRYKPHHGEEDLPDEKCALMLERFNTSSLGSSLD